MRSRYWAVNCDTMSWPVSFFVRFSSGFGLAASNLMAVTMASLYLAGILVKDFWKARSTRSLGKTTA